MCLFGILFSFPKHLQMDIFSDVDYKYLRDSMKGEFWALPASNLLSVFQ